MKSTESTGSISLHRTTATYQASFTIICNSLAALQQRLHQLHPLERSYYDSLKVDARRYSYLLGRLAAKTALLHYTKEPAASMASFYIGFGVFQYPVVRELPYAGIQVCITHCEDIGIAFAYPEEHPLSIDIEKIDPAKASAMQALITEHDRQQLAGLDLDEDSGQALIWTAKESLSKISRTGLTMDASILETGQITGREQRLVTTYRHWIQYKTISWPANGYMCSLTMPRNTEPQLSSFEASYQATCHL